MTATRPAAIVRWVLAAPVVCAALALRDTVASQIGSGIDPALVVTDIRDQILWAASYNGMWAVLTPFIFAMAARHPFRRDRWLGPLAVHLPTSVIVASLAPVAASILFGGLVLGRGWPSGPGALVTPFWTRLMLYRAVVDTSFYWLILAAGLGLQAWDADQARRRRAAELERAVVDAQVGALKMKLQPHFLFNTLNSITFLAVEGDARGVERMVERLAGLLRASMQPGGRQVTTVAEELALLDQYLAIEETRFADRLAITREIDPPALGAELPSLILQPIVENSLKHGFSKRIGASRLGIGVRLDGATLVVTVEDDGPGLPPGWDLATHCGRGLKNVIERLDMLYPAAWSFTLTDGSRGGTVAALRVPARRTQRPSATPAIRRLERDRPRHRRQERPR